MTKSTATQFAIEVFRTAAPVRPTRRPFSLPHSLLIDQALTFEERAAEEGDLLEYFRHKGIRHAIEASAFGDGGT